MKLKLFLVAREKQILLCCVIGDFLNWVSIVVAHNSDIGENMVVAHERLNQPDPVTGLSFNIFITFINN